MEEHLREFLAYLRYECGLSPNTVLSYRRDITQLFSFLTARNILDLKELSAVVLAEHFRKRLDEGLSPRSTARAISAIRMFLRFLVIEGRLTENYARWIDTPKTWQRLPCILNETEVDRLLESPRTMAVPYPLRDTAILEVGTLEIVAFAGSSAGACNRGFRGCRMPEGASLASLVDCPA